MIFQDPFGSLDPRMTIAEIVAEPLDVQGMARGAASGATACVELLDMVALGPEYADRRSQRALRRSAPARRHRARAGGRARAPRRRRAGLGARRLDPGADRQPARRAEAAARPRDAVHLARHRRDGSSLRPHRRGLSRPHHGDRPDARADRRPAPSLHRGAALGGAGARPRQRRERIVLAGRRAEPGRSAERLRVPHALPLRAARLRGRTAAAARRSGPSTTPHASATTSFRRAPRRSARAYRSHEIPVSAGG